jgi:hypothetical protein
MYGQDSKVLAFEVQQDSPSHVLSEFACSLAVQARDIICAVPITQVAIVFSSRAYSAGSAFNILCSVAEGTRAVDVFIVCARRAAR